ncbi:hypothetical protein [uncultured Gimesia sp.]|uniref:hypothetical protein n=1 Tax=uncultured Gimesia sp. TaxID=1678688 RepID=UPI0030DBA02E|tara:strand:- start:24417 stop:25781 length:1365 start_codon:yes stop_codon:yes gene_type:complete
METPEFLRPFQFDLPLFANKCGPASPWNQKVGTNKPDDVSERQARVTYGIFKEFSETRLAEDRNALQTMIENGEQGTTAFENLQFSITQQEEKFANEGGGKHQFPFINYDEFSFPIFRVKRDAVGNVILGEIPLQPYNIDSFSPPWFPRTGNQHSGFKALDVPLPDGPFRPAGPQNQDSDGTIILYDAQTKTEYDFWQVTTQLDRNGLSAGGGIVGDTVLATGSIAEFDATGVGARYPEIEPSGSARASGLPYLGGLILPEDLEKGADSKIQHALVFAMPQLRFFPDRLAEQSPNWVYPATRTESGSPIANPDALAAGQRIRLKEKLHDHNGETHAIADLINDESLPPIVRIFLETLHYYGAFLVDGGGGFGFAAEDIYTANLSAELARELTAPAKLDEDTTPWQGVIETLNDYLFQKLLNGSGLAFALLDAQHGFRSNFAVAEDIKAFYLAKC